MSTPRYVRWRDGQTWLGYVAEFPDYLTQARPLCDLAASLRALEEDLRGGEIPGVDAATPRGGARVRHSRRKR